MMNSKRRVFYIKHIPYYVLGIHLFIRTSYMDTVIIYAYKLSLMGLKAI